MNQPLFTKLNSSCPSRWSATITILVVFTASCAYIGSPASLRVLQRHPAPTTAFRGTQSTVTPHTLVSNTTQPVASIAHTNTSGEEQLHVRFPKCIIIGVQKGGTSALINLMNIHPAIVMTEIPETHFFDKDVRYQRGLKYYKRYWRPTSSNEIPIEKTPAYFHTKNVPERIYRINTSVKFIITLVNPVKRLVSAYLMSRRNAYGKGFNGKYPELRELVLDRYGNINNTSAGVRVSTYHLHFSRWLKYFPLNQIHMVDGDQLSENPYAELGAVETFLGLEHFISDQNLVYVKSKGYYCPVNENRQPVCLGSDKGHSHPTLNPEIKEKLINYFKPLNEKFFKLVGRRFDWD